MVYKFETFCGVFIYHLAVLVQKKLQKKVFLGHSAGHNIFPLLMAECVLQSSLAFAQRPLEAQVLTGSKRLSHQVCVLGVMKGLGTDSRADIKRERSQSWGREAGWKVRVTS